MESRRVNGKVVLVFRKPGHGPEPNLMSATLSCSLGTLFSWESERGRRMWAPFPRLRLTLRSLTCHLNCKSGASLAFQVAARRDWSGLKYKSSQHSRIFCEILRWQHKCSLIFERNTICTGCGLWERRDLWRKAPGDCLGSNLKQSLAALLKQGPIIQTALQGEACTKSPAFHTELPAWTLFLPSEPALVKEFLDWYFN